MEKVFTEENLAISVERLLEKNDSCGIDGIFVRDFREYWEINKERIVQELLQGKYEPDEVLVEEILNRKGKKRRISKFTCTDRVILDAIKREVTPIWEGQFSAFSYAYQENKGIQDAVKQALVFIQEGNEWVAEIDIENFFDEINQQILCEKLQMKIQDERIIKLIVKYFQVLVCDDFTKEKKKKGLIQGSPISPLFSNVYMMEFDNYLESKFRFCRFSDNINIYCKTEEEAKSAIEDVRRYLMVRLCLPINEEKTGVYSIFMRSFLGYEFYRDETTEKVLAKKYERGEEKHYNHWNVSAIQKIDRHYHIVNDGILTRKDYTVLFENEERKYYLPVETCGSINIYSKVTFSSSFFEYVKSKKLQVNLFDKYGELVGCFTTSEHYDRAKTILRQAAIYNCETKRLELAKQIEIASLHNQRENLRYYYKRKKYPQLQDTIEEITDIIISMKDCADMESLLLLEARAKQQYLQAFDYMIDDSTLPFEKRTRRPPLNEVNALISFGNVFLYQRIATEINKTALDVRIGIVHATNNRSESLNLDIAEIFKPIIVDRAIFTVLHNMEIVKEEHFERGEDGGIYLNKSGKRIFIHAIEQKLYQKVTIGGVRKTYDTLIRDEIKKILRTIKYDEKYKPFKYT